MSDNHTDLVCPQCRNRMSFSGDSFVCGGCSRVFKNESGIPDLRTGNEPYWCEVPQEVMKEFNAGIVNSGWDEGFKNLCRKRNDMGLYYRAVDTDRANWFYFIPLGRDASVLDVGAGWGAISFSLAKYFKTVVSLDAVFERVQFTEIRRRQEQVDNMRCICGNIINLPFGDNSFDLVVLNGVLEWVGLSDLSVSTYEVQLRVLREINRILKPGGYIYIGIENRYGIDYFLGFKDHHSGLKYATILPRFMAHLYSKIKTGKTYRVYTHSYGGYKRILNRAGFNDHKFLFPVSTYRKFYYLIPLNSSNVMEFCFKYLIPEKLIFTSDFVKRLYGVLLLVFKLKLTWLVKYFTSSYSIISQKPYDK